MAGFWGPPSSTMDWCEENYAVNPYVAEFFNTISNAPIIVLALIGLILSVSQRFERRFSVLHLSSIVSGVGSVLFHSTLHNVQQQSDETPMVWVMLLYIYVLYSPDWHYRSTMPTFLALYGTAYAILHSKFGFVLGFQLHYVFLCLLCLPRMYKYYIHTKDPAARNLAHMYSLSLCLGGVCWLSDRYMCTRLSALPVNPQGHAWWHFFMGFNTYFGITFLQFCRAQQLHWNPQLKYLKGLLPFVQVTKENKSE